MSNLANIIAKFYFLINKGCHRYGNTSNNFERLHTIDIFTGEIIWSAQLKMDITWSSAATSSDGILYIASMNNYSEGRKGMINSFLTNSTVLLTNAQVKSI